MNIKVFVQGICETNCFLVWDGSEGIIIDPGGSPEELMKFLEKNSIALKYVINTHAHFDHILGNNLLVASTGAKLVVNRLDVDALRDPFFNLSAYFLEPFSSIEPDILMDDGDRLEFGGGEVVCIHTPGHTPGSSCFCFPEQKVVFTGDTLFKFSYGRVDFPGGDSGKMMSSLRKLLSAFEDDYMCYPGHGEMFRFGDVRSWLGEVMLG